MSLLLGVPVQLSPLMRRTLNFNLQAREEEKWKKNRRHRRCMFGRWKCCVVRGQQKQSRCKLRTFGECQKREVCPEFHVFRTVIKIRNHRKSIYFSQLVFAYLFYLFAVSVLVLRRSTARAAHFKKSISHAMKLHRVSRICNLCECAFAHSLFAGICSTLIRKQESS